MNRKLKNTLGLVALLLFILAAGGVYLYIFQKGKISDKTDKLNELNAYDYNTDQLNVQYQDLLLRASVLDSVLAARTFNIPANISSIKFFDFINDASASFSEDAHLDVEFFETKPDKEFFFYEYKISGSGSFNDLYRLNYAIEQSKELKKIKSAVLNSIVSNNKEGMPRFDVSFTMNVEVYFSMNNRYATTDLVENDLRTASLYDIFFPLIRNEIPPNIDDLLDVQGARLLALIPEGAFLSDARGNTYLLWEGEQVYLGYLTKINYEQNKVSFILNKGGIIEKIDILLENEEPNKKVQ